MCTQLIWAIIEPTKSISATKQTLMAATFISMAVLITSDDGFFEEVNGSLNQTGIWKTHKSIHNFFNEFSQIIT